MAIEKIVKGNAISSASELRCQSSIQKVSVGQCRALTELDGSSATN